MSQKRKASGQRSISEFLSRAKHTDCDNPVTCEADEDAPGTQSSSQQHDSPAVVEADSGDHDDIGDLETVTVDNAVAAVLGATSEPRTESDPTGLHDIGQMIDVAASKWTKQLASLSDVQKMEVIESFCPGTEA